MTRPENHNPISIEQGQPPATLTEDDIAGLVRRAATGEVEAFGALYRLYAEPIYRYFFYRVRFDSDAHDLTAQVFLNAWQAILRYRQEDIPFLVWLYTIARNLLINFNRQQARRPQTQLDEGLAGREETTNPQLVAQRRAANEELALAFEQLNEEQQQVIYYRFVENWSHADLARRLGKTEGAVRAMQFRALETLRRLLEKAGGSEFER